MEKMVSCQADENGGMASAENGEIEAQLQSCAFEKWMSDSLFNEVRDNIEEQNHSFAIADALMQAPSSMFSFSLDWIFFQKFSSGWHSIIKY